MRLGRTPASSFSARAEISFPRGKPTPGKHEIEPRESGTPVTARARADPPPREPRRRRARPGLREAGAVGPRHLAGPPGGGPGAPPAPVTVLAAPQSGPGEGLRAPRSTGYGLDWPRPAPSFSAQGALVPLVSRDGAPHAGLSPSCGAVGGCADRGSPVSGFQNW